MNEKENTARILAGDPPLVTSVWCGFGFHNWTKWSKSFKDSEGRRVYQDSHCADCNKHRAREVRAKSS